MTKKKAARARPIGRHVVDGKHWQISYLLDGPRFFAALPNIFPFGATLYFEVYEPAPRLWRLLKKYPVDQEIDWGLSVNVRQVHFCPKFVEEIQSLLHAQGPLPLQNLYGFSPGRRMLFYFHDALDHGELRVSGAISLSKIQKFCRETGPICVQRDALQFGDPEILPKARVQNPPNITFSVSA